MIEIEFPEAESSDCSCCGGVATGLTRFVTQDDEAFAIYYAAFSSNHPEKGVLGIVSFGEWWKDGEIPASRVAIAFEMWSEENEYKVGIINADESLWADVDIIGRKLSRDEALAHPNISDVFHITDHMTADDPEITGFFEPETVH